MNKVILSRDDVDRILKWRDENVPLVHEYPCPMKMVEILIPDEGIRIKGVREGKIVRLYFGRNNRNYWNAKFEITNFLLLKTDQNDIPRGQLQGVVTLYFSLMALFVYGNHFRDSTEMIDDVDESTPQNEKKPGKPAQSPRKKNKDRVTYILRSGPNGPEIATHGSHRSPKGTFSVRGHYRHYKSGKVVWVAEYQKGTGKKKSKKYKLGGGEQ